MGDIVASLAPSVTRGLSEAQMASSAAAHVNVLREMRDQRQVGNALLVDGADRVVHYVGDQKDGQAEYSGVV